MFAFGGRRGDRIKLLYWDGQLLTRGNTGSEVWADAAYRSEEMEAKLRDQKL